MLIDHEQLSLDLLEEIEKHGEQDGFWAKGYKDGLIRAIGIVHEQPALPQAAASPEGWTASAVPAKEFAVVESMTRLVVGIYIVRIWREEEDLRPIYEATRTELLAAIGKAASFGTPNTPAEIIRTVYTLERINAVEVVGESGQGVICYKNWP